MFGLTCVEAELVSGAVAAKREGGASEGVGCCCWDNSEPVPTMVIAPVPDDDPSVPEKTPVETSETTGINCVTNCCTMTP